MRALRRRPADAVGGVDAELVRLDVPARHRLQLAANSAPSARAAAARPARRRPPARSARTSASCRRAGRCIESAASAARCGTGASDPVAGQHVAAVAARAVARRRRADRHRAAGVPRSRATPSSAPRSSCSAAAAAAAARERMARARQLRGKPGTIGAHRGSYLISIAQSGSVRSPRAAAACHCWSRRVKGSNA